MRVGINGMGRMGRLALRAAMGGVQRAGDDPRARQPARRRACQRDQGRRCGDRASAGVRQHPWPLARARSRSRTSAAFAIGNQHLGFSARRLAGRRRLGRSRLRYRAGMHRQIPEARAARRLLRARRQARDRRGAGQGRPRAQRRRRRQRSPLRARPASPADGGLVHHELPGPGGQGRARGDRHPRTARSPPSTIRPTPMSSSMRRTRICAARARRCCRCSRPRPAARPRSR